MFGSVLASTHFVSTSVDIFPPLIWLICVSFPWSSASIRLESLRCDPGCDLLSYCDFDLPRPCGLAPSLNPTATFDGTLSSSPPFPSSSPFAGSLLCFGTPVVCSALLYRLQQPSLFVILASFGIAFPSSANVPFQVLPLHCWRLCNCAEQSIHFKLRTGWLEPEKNVDEKSEGNQRGVVQVPLS